MTVERYVQRVEPVEAWQFDGTLEDAQGIIEWLGTGYECSRITFDSGKGPDFELHICGNCVAPGGYDGKDVVSGQWVVKQTLPSWRIYVVPDMLSGNWEKIGD